MNNKQQNLINFPIIPDPVVQMENVVKRYRDFELDRVGFDLARGCITGLLGQNGAGKTTIIRLLLGLIHQDEGHIRLFGQELLPDTAPLLRRKIGVVLDEGYFYDFLTLNQMKQIYAFFFQDWDEASFQKYSDRFQLSLGKKISELSRGMRTKFAISLALSHQADLLIMDEPTHGLDPLVREELLLILYELLQDENKSILFSSHITSDLEKVADYILLIHDGRLLLYQEKDQLLETHCLVRGPARLLDEEANRLFVKTRCGPYGFEGLSSDRAAVARYFGHTVEIEKANLEQIMLYYVRSDSDGAN